MRSSGILLPVFSLPGKYEIGCFSEEAYDFVDFLSASGQHYWQILPMGPAGFGESPYSPLSTFAGNHYFIDPDTLVENGLITNEEKDICCTPCTDPTEVNYTSLHENRLKLLSLAFERAPLRSEDYEEFKEKNSFWLDDYAAFMQLKSIHSQRPFTEWPPELRDRREDALSRFIADNAKAIEFHKWIQFEFHREWNSIRAYANDRGIKIIGDVPFYVAADSADTWSHPELFELDENRDPAYVGGAPPSPNYPAQRWGTPVYRWKAHAEDGYSWWTRRIEHDLELADIIRFDHFIGFDRYYSIPATGEHGQFEEGPGIELFNTIKNELGTIPAIAEDLGMKFDTTDRLLAETGFPPMEVVQHAFKYIPEHADPDDPSLYFPDKYPEHCVAYTGTHDNQTLLQFVAESDDRIRRIISKKLGIDENENYDSMTEGLIALGLSSPAETCIVPMGDYLHLGGWARINEPDTIGYNWKWRMVKDSLNDELAEHIRTLTATSQRL